MQKSSFGIILCRINLAHEIEILLVKKRCTYEFVDFVTGKYTSTNHPVSHFKPVEDIVTRMTQHELNIIKTCSFSHMWAHIFPIIKLPLSEKLASKFIKEFKGREHELYAAVCGVKKINHTIWEIPKGGKCHKSESGVICAMRELEEETNIKKSSYQVIPGATRYLTVIDNGTEYAFTFYVALISYQESTNYTSKETNEITENRWFTMNTIRYTNDPLFYQLNDIVKPIPTIIKKFIKGERSIMVKMK